MLDIVRQHVVKHKSFAYYLMFSIATSALGFIASILLMRLISPEEFGRISIFLSIQFFVAPIISFAAENLIAVKKSKLSQTEYKNFRKRYVTFSYVAFSFIQTIFILTFFLGGFNDAFLILIPATALVKFLIGLATIEFVMEEKSIQFGISAFFTALMSLTLTLVFFAIFSSVADWRIVAMLLADIAFLMVRYRGRLKLLLVFSIDKKDFKDIVFFGFPLLLAVAPAWALNESDKIIVANIVDMNSVGLYGAAVTVGSFMATFNSALLNAALPRLYKALSDTSVPVIETIRYYLFGFLSVSIAFAVGFAFLYFFTAEMILPEKYKAARDIVYYVIIFSLARSLYAVLGAAIDYFGMTIQKLKGISLAGATAVAAIIFCVMQFGIAGAAAGVGVGYIVLSIVLWFELKDKSSKLYEISGK